MPAFPVSVPNVVSAWEKARHFLSTGQPLLGEFQANNKRANITTRSLEEGGLLDGGGGWSRGLLGGLWMLEIMTKIISWRFI